jgi:hypothetical protein
VSAGRHVAKQQKLKELAGIKSEGWGSFESTSTSKDYLFTFVRVNFSDFHLGVVLIFPQPPETNMGTNRMSFAPVTK